MNRAELENKISDLCDQAGCTDKKREIHRKQLTDRSWNPHPSTAFVAWWPTHPDYQNGIDAVRAYSCQRYRDEYLEHKGLGLT